MKICDKCNKEYNIIIKDICEHCYRKQYYLNNKEKIIIQNKLYVSKNKEKRKIKIKEWIYNNKIDLANKQKIWREQNPNYNKEHYVKNREKILNKSKNNKKILYKTNSLFKLKTNIRSSINNYFKKNNLTKSKRTEQILGCTFEELKQHLEQQFEPWMNWENRGGKVVTEQNKYWDIDHIIPLNTIKTEEDIIKLNHYTNLRPLCSYYNRFIKKDKTI